jgi:hypothetical protein
MLRATIRATEDSDPDTESAKLRAAFVSDGHPQFVADSATSQVRSLLRDLVDRGRQLKAVGSQMHVTRKIEGDGYRVELIFRVGDRRGLFERFIDRIRGR